MGRLRSRASGQGFGIPLGQIQVLLGQKLSQFKRFSLRKEIQDHKYKICTPNECLFRIRKDVMINHKF